MSDEPTPPSLRLKPRQPATPAVPVPAALPPASATPPVAEAAAQPNDPLRLRIKPKAPPPEGSPTDTSGVTFSTPMPFSSPPMAPAIGVPATPLPPPTAAKLVPSVPLPPVQAPQVLPSKPQYVQTPRDLADPAYPVPPKSSRPVIKADKWLAGLVLFLLVLVGGFFAIRYFINAHPKPPAPATATAPNATPAIQPVPSKNDHQLVANPTSVAGKAVAKARDAVAAHDKLEQDQGVGSILDEPLAGSTTRAPTGSSNAPASIASAAPLAPEATVAEPSLPPSDAFQQFVVNMRVNGVFQGENARAMLNGKMYHLGDSVDAKLGISLFKIEVEAKQIIFRDTTGAIISRHY